jgi:hypothetical protein
MNKKLALNTETLRLLESIQLGDVEGGRPNPTRTVCAGECPPPPPRSKGVFSGCINC